MKELRLTSFDTIVGDDFKEMRVEDFFKILDENLGDSYTIRCSSTIYNGQFRHMFKIIFENEVYYLLLDKEIMDNYALGIYNNFTSKLKKLVDRVQMLEQRKNELVREKQIIKDAESGLGLSEDEKHIYLEHLKKSNKFSFLKIKTYFSNLIDDLKVSINNMDDWVWETDIIPFRWLTEGWFYFVMSICISFVIGVIIAIGLALAYAHDSSISSNILNWFWLSLLPEATYLGPVIKFIEYQTKVRFNRLVNFIDTNKMTNHKIKQLEEELDVKRIVHSNNDNLDRQLLETNSKQTNSLEDPIFENLSNIVISLEYINLNDRKPLLDEVRKIAIEYAERLKKIKKQSQEEGINLGEDNYLTLQQDIFGRIALLELKIKQVRTNNISDSNIDKQLLTVTEMIDACYNSDDKVVGGHRPSRTRKQNEHNN